MIKNMIAPFILVCALLYTSAKRIIEGGLSGQEAVNQWSWLLGMLFILGSMVYIALRQPKKPEDPFEYLYKAQKRFGKKP